MTAEERFAVVFEKLEQAEPEPRQEIRITYEPTQEADEIRRLMEIVAEVSSPNYQFITTT